MSNIKIIVDEVNKFDKFNECNEQDNLNYIITEFLDEGDADDFLFQDYNAYTLKQLTYICEYYGISKNIKRKSTRDEITHMIIYFENLSINYLIVNKRKKLWFYLAELKSDKYLKKFIFF